MPTLTSGIYEVRLKTFLAQQELLNVFNYGHIGDQDGKGAILAPLWESHMATAIENVLHTAVNQARIEVECLTDNEAFLVRNLIGFQGAIAGELMPSFVVGSYRYDRFYTDTRSGWKRIGPMSEGDVNQDSFIAAYYDKMVSLAALMAAPITDGTDTFVPLIVRKEYPRPTVWTVNNISGVTPIDRVTTQNSRKSF